MSSYPDLVSDYVSYLRYRRNFDQTNNLDLSNIEFIYPTTLLPLSEIILNYRERYTPPKLYPPRNYIATIINPISSNMSHSYAPIVNLPENCEEADATLQRIFAMQKQPHYFGGESAFKYVVSELVDNIYQHSGFSRAVIMGQRYDSKGFIDLSFFDNGITIPQSFRNGGLDYDASSAIRQALNGKSTKDDDRGFGLRTSLDLLTLGLNCKFFIASEKGAIYCEKDKHIQYRVLNADKLSGTLISARIPINTPIVDIYDFVE